MASNIDSNALPFSTNYSSSYCSLPVSQKSDGVSLWEKTKEASVAQLTRATGHMKMKEPTAASAVKKDIEWGDSIAEKLKLDVPLRQGVEQSLTIVFDDGEAFELAVPAKEDGFPDNVQLEFKVLQNDGWAVKVGTNKPSSCAEKQHQVQDITTAVNHKGFMHSFKALNGLTSAKTEKGYTPLPTALPEAAALGSPAGLAAEEVGAGAGVDAGINGVGDAARGLPVVDDNVNDEGPGQKDDGDGLAVGGLEEKAQVEAKGVDEQGQPESGLSENAKQSGQSGEAVGQFDSGAAPKPASVDLAADSASSSDQADRNLPVGDDQPVVTDESEAPAPASARNLTSVADRGLDDDRMSVDSEASAPESEADASEQNEMPSDNQPAESTLGYVFRTVGNAVSALSSLVSSREAAPASGEAATETEEQPVDQSEEVATDSGVAPVKEKVSITDASAADAATEPAQAQTSGAAAVEEGSTNKPVGPNLRNVEDQFPEDFPNPLNLKTDSSNQSEGSKRSAWIGEGVSTPKANESSVPTDPNVKVLHQPAVSPRLTEVSPQLTESKAARKVTSVVLAPRSSDTPRTITSVVLAPRKEKPEERDKTKAPVHQSSEKKTKQPPSKDLLVSVMDDDLDLSDSDDDKIDSAVFEETEEDLLRLSSRKKESRLLDPSKLLVDDRDLRKTKKGPKPLAPITTIAERQTRASTLMKPTAASQAKQTGKFVREDASAASSTTRRLAEPDPARIDRLTRPTAASTAARSEKFVREDASAVSSTTRRLAEPDSAIIDRLTRPTAASTAARSKKFVRADASAASSTTKRSAEPDPASTNRLTRSTAASRAKAVDRTQKF